MGQGNGFSIGLALAGLCVPSAGTGKESGLDPKRNPEVQARAAIRAGDFRVARLVYVDTDSVGHIHHGEDTPGLACDGGLSEAGARDVAWSKSGQRFAAGYNAALVADPRYPDRDVCVPLDPRSKNEEWPDFATVKGRPLHPDLSVNRAARASRPDLVRTQIGRGALFDRHDRWHRRPLHWAARRGDLASLDMLLAAGAKTQDKEPSPPLLLAVDSAHLAAAERLLAAGASPFGCGRMDARLSWGSSNTIGRRTCPLRHAIERDLVPIVAPLVRSALARGTYYERDRLTEDLLKAVDFGRTGAARAFLEATGSARDRYLQPAVMRMAAYRLDRTMLRTLMALGGGIAARTPAEERLWRAAAELGRPEPLAMLIWFGRDLNYLGAADRIRLEKALPGLTSAGLRPFVVKAAEGREKAWDAVLAGDLEALDALAVAGVDFAERRGETALSRAAGRDSAAVRWMLAHGARPDTYHERNLTLECSSISDDFGNRKHSRAQRLSFLPLCGEAESWEPKSRPKGDFARHALATAINAADPERIELLLPRSRPEAALDRIEFLAEAPPTYPGRLALLTRLAALAAKGHREELAYDLRSMLREGRFEAATAVLAGFIPSGRGEIDAALDLDSGDRCRPEPYRLLRDRGVALADWRSFERGNLFSLAADCDSAELVALASTLPGIGINAVDDSGKTAADYLPSGGEAARAMAALGARECEELHGEDSEKCRSGGPEPDPAL